MTPRLVDVSLRDGLQDLDAFVPTEAKRRVLTALDAAGLDEIEFTAFVHPAWVPPLTDAEVLAASPEARGARTPLSALVPNLHGVQRALSADVGTLVLVTAATESFARKNLNRTMAEDERTVAETLALLRGRAARLRVGVSVAFGCPFEGPVPLDRLLAVVERLVSAGVADITLADTVGAADPDLVTRVSGAVRGRHPGIDLGLHLHGRHALAGALAGVEAGVDRLDGSLLGLGGCPYAPGAPGNIDLEQLVPALAQRGGPQPVDPGRLAHAAAELRAALAAAQPLSLSTP